MRKLIIMHIIVLIEKDLFLSLHLTEINILNPNAVN